MLLLLDCDSATPVAVEFLCSHVGQRWSNCVDVVVIFLWHRCFIKKIKFGSPRKTIQNFGCHQSFTHLWRLEECCFAWRWCQCLWRVSDSVHRKFFGRDFSLVSFVQPWERICCWQNALGQAIIRCISAFWALLMTQSFRTFPRLRLRLKRHCFCSKPVQESKHETGQIRKLIRGGCHCELAIL